VEAAPAASREEEVEEHHVGVSLDGALSAPSLAAPL